MKRKMSEITTDIMSMQMGLTFSEDEFDIQLEELFAELYDKEDGIYWLFKDNDKKIELVKEHMDKCKRIMNMIKNGQESIKGMVIERHDSVGSLPKHSVFNPVAIRNSNGAVDAYDEDIIPGEYYITVETKRLDKKRMVEEMKAGVKIPGVRLVKKPFVNGLK
jgi:hypothetical protein